MADVGAESMGGGTILFRRKMIQREISRALVLNLSGKASGASALPRIFLSLTPPSLLSRGTPRVCFVFKTTLGYCRGDRGPPQVQRISRSGILLHNLSNGSSA